ncbi:alkane hydroxylase MAH1-like [Primulina tabacum]|uniref:alkane hydroxylase MAH1-like n=1 Tax=Primulina tabacum TaxID=48773 RepID=UPI003F5A6C88
MATKIKNDSCPIMAIFQNLDIFSIVLSLGVLCLYRRLTRETKSAPTNWPVVGMLPGVLRNLHRAHEYATQVLSECGGTYVFKGPWFFNIDMVFTCDPANIHHIFSKNFPNYPKGPQFRKIFEILGDGVFNADYELWEMHRRVTLSFLTNANFYNLLENGAWKKIETGLMPVLENFCEQGKDFDLQDIFQRFTFDNICNLVLDYDPGSLSIYLPYIPCEKAFSTSVEPLLHRHIVPERIWRLQQWLKFGNEKILDEAKKAFDEFIFPLVSLKDEEQEDDFKLMKVFKKVYEENRINSSGDLREFLKDTALSLMFAGRDTTSTCLTWLFWLIAKNPSTETKILQEIETELKIKTQDSSWRFFKVEESRKLVYLHGALCESLRLFPPVALEHKSPMHDDILPSGHHLRKNSKMIISFYSVGRLEKVWGKDCLDFKPERWISASGKIRHEPSYNFPAFNVGPRTCIGKEMAFIQMKVVAAAVIYHYRVELVEGHPVVPLDSVILQAKHGLRVRLSKRT